MKRMAPFTQASGAACRFYNAFYWLTRPCILSQSSVRPGRSLPPHKYDCYYRLFSVSGTKSFNRAHFKRQLSQSPKDEAPQSTADHVRQIMRYVPQSVTIITATAPIQSSVESGTSARAAPVESAFRGMTVSSFNTVTLEPTPIVSFNVKVPSATHTAIKQSGNFLVHLMKSSSTGAKIADAFARGGNAQGEVFKQVATEGEGVKIFAGHGTRGAPLIVGDGVYRVLRCRALPEKEMAVADHVVLIGEVMGVFERHDIGQGSVDPDKELGLVYVNRAFRYPGEIISPHVEPDETTSGPDKQTSESVPFQRTLGMNVRRGDEHNAD